MFQGKPIMVSQSVLVIDVWSLLRFVFHLISKNGDVFWGAFKKSFSISDIFAGLCYDIVCPALLSDGANNTVICWWSCLSPSDDQYRAWKDPYGLWLAGWNLSLAFLKSVCFYAVPLSLIFLLYSFPSSPSTPFFPPSQCSFYGLMTVRLWDLRGLRTVELYGSCGNVISILILSFSLQARIKAINTFFGKNGFCSVQDSGVYSQHAPLQAPYDSSAPVYMQSMYSPQQQYPVYPIVSPSWNPQPSNMPYFETPLVRTLIYYSECPLKLLCCLF